jgi:hypothetical protein
MSPSKESDPRKRQRLVTPPQQQPGEKRLKLIQDSTPSSSDFYLSKFDLTEKALRELDGRNSKSLPSSLPGSQQLSGSVPCSIISLKILQKPNSDIKDIAREGGPDLSDLIGVR